MPHPIIRLFVGATPCGRPAAGGSKPEWAAESGGRHGELEGCGFLYVGSDSIRPGRGGMEQRTGRAQLAPTYKGRVQRGLLLTRTSSLDRTRKGGVEAAKVL